MQQPSLKGQFLTDSIEIGRPFRYALTYRHPPTAEVLFPDTAYHFLPFRVKEVTVSPTLTTGEGKIAVSRDSAVYTLISFETDSVQLLQVPIRLVNANDCTVIMSQIDTVFLRTHLKSPGSKSKFPKNLSLASETELAKLQQQFNYPVLGEVLLAAWALLTLIYLLFGRQMRRKWHLYQLYLHQKRFLRDYTKLSQQLSAENASEVANQAVIIWKTYLEELERQPYASLTTPEIAERTGDERVADALREADRMIYGGEFSGQAFDALRVLRTVAVQAYRRRRSSIQEATQPLHFSEETIPSTRS
ncbi:hypothetical protein WBJ53_02810 [Spirosoma sp. SC4-14]|uniref:hypothetical protein n=1 Tax=Spirosoma sp. SC4-14 TaxID=3128900 RepID=UPI0030CC99AD